MQNEKLISTNPALSFVKVGEVQMSSEEEIRQKVTKAQATRTVWKEMGVKARIEKLLPIRDEFIARREEIAKLISRETGKAISESISEVTRYTENELNWFLENGESALSDEPTLEDERSLHRIVYEPYGVAAVITPWNFPFGMAIWGIFPALIAGNPVVWKTSEECPLTGKLIEEIILNHELPDGVFAEVYGAGEVGEMLARSNINLIWFTGSTQTGKSLYKIAAEKFIKAVLEMGGSNPCVVFDDIDAAKAAPIIFNGRYRNNGQVCSALKRLIVHESVVGPLSVELKKIIESQKVGDPLSPETDLGSLVAERQKILLEEQLKNALDQGAHIVAQTRLDDKLDGAFFPPTLLSNVTPGMRVWREEVFGPIFPLMTFKTEEEAVALANDSDFGLGARIMSGDIQRAERIASQIDAGSITLNFESRFLACNPFGGYKNSGLGRERGKAGLQELCQIKVIQRVNNNIVC